jgi:hypothetical protein
VDNPNRELPLGQLGAIFPAKVAHFEWAAICPHHMHLAHGFTVTTINQYRIAGAAGFPSLAPLPKRDQRWQQRLPFRRKRVDHFTPIVRAIASLQNPMLHKFRQPVRQDIARDPEMRLELLEMAEAIEGGPENQEGPALTDNLERCRQAAPSLVIVEIRQSHILKISQFLT